MRTLTLLALLAVATPAHAGKIALEFALQPGSAAETSQEVQTQAMAGQSQEPSSFSTTARLTAAESDDGLVLTWSDIDVKMDGDRDPIENAIMGAMGAIDLGMRVDKSGTITGSAKDLAAQSVALEAAVKKGVRGTEPGMSDEEFETMWQMIAPMLEVALSAEALWARYESDWQWRVSRWSGMKVAAGKAQQENLTLPRKEFGADVTLPAAHRYTVEADVPCYEGDAAKQCVRIVSTVSYDADASLPHMQAFLEKAFAAAMPGVSLSLTHYADSFEQTLVTEPATLRFWSVDRSARQEMGFSIMGQQLTGLNTTQSHTEWAWQ